MANAAIETPIMSQEDWSLIAQLLEARQRELLAEIRHTDKRAFRDALHERLTQVEDVLRRVNPGAAAPSA